MLNALVQNHLLWRAVAGSPFWESYLASVASSNATRIHLGVFVEPYLRYIISGVKTVESRFSRNAVAPFRRVGAGDVLLLKRSGGAVEAIAYVSNAWSYRLAREVWARIRGEFASAMCVSEEFLRGRRDASYVTLMQLKEVRAIEPLSVGKRDRRGWVVLYDPMGERHPDAGQLGLTL
jgi:hypothetical protein